MSNLVNYFAIQTLRNARKRRQAVKPLAESKVMPLLEGAVPDAELALPAVVEPDLPVIVEKDGDADVIGFWLLPVQQDYYSVPIYRRYTIGRTSIESHRGRGTYSTGAAIFAVYDRLVKHYPPFRGKVTPQSRKVLAGKDSEAVTDILDRLQQAMIGVGASYYISDKKDVGYFFCGSSIPHYWDDFVETVVDASSRGDGVGANLDIDVLYVSASGRSYAMDKAMLKASVGDDLKHISTFHEMSRSLEARPKKHGGGGTGSVAPSVSYNAEDIATDSPQAIRQKLFTYFQGLWDSGTYSADSERAAYHNIDQHLDNLVDQCQKMASGFRGNPETRLKLDPMLKRSQALGNLLRSWNHTFHSKTGDTWQSSEHALDLGDNDLGESVDNFLVEVTFRKLMSLTSDNGQYRRGGLVKIDGRWVTDPTVKDRIANSRFVVTKPPKPSIDADGLVRINYNFKSKTDRATTGLRHKGYVKFVPPGFIKRTLRKLGLLKARSGWDADVHVFCDCPDFKYRWHVVLAKKGASHVPSGQGGEAINTPPNITNPSKKLSMCKHLAAMGGYIVDNSDDWKLARGKPATTTTATKTPSSAITPTGVNKAPKVKPGSTVTPSRTTPSRVRK